MRKFIISLICGLFMVSCVGLNLGPNYVSFAEKYPEQAKSMLVAPLGGTVETEDGSKFMVIAEAKHPTDEAWLQWVDSNVGEKQFDGEADMLLVLVLNPDDSVFWRVLPVHLADSIMENVFNETGKELIIHRM